MSLCNRHVGQLNWMNCSLLNPRSLVNYFVVAFWVQDYRGWVLHLSTLRVSFYGFWVSTMELLQTISSDYSNKWLRKWRALKAFFLALYFQSSMLNEYLLLSRWSLNMTNLFSTWIKFPYIEACLTVGSGKGEFMKNRA